MKNSAKNNLPLVSIIIACRNEEKFIGECLDSIISNNYPKDKIEVMVVDGMSTDDTKKIVEEYAKHYSFIKLLENPKKFTPFAFNIGIEEAKGEIIMIMGAHAGYEKDYISKCVKYLIEYNADNVGGVMKTLPSKNTLWARAIAYCLSHPFGAGGSYFRIGSYKPRWVDTVFGGCYKREVFDKVGLFNENLARSQDMEFNLRLKKAGGKILLVPEIEACYYSDTNFRKFSKHNFSNGFWTTYPLKFGVRIFSWRHLIPLVFVGSLILSLFFSLLFWQARFVFDLIFGSYFLLALFFSVKICLKRGIKYLIILPLMFFVFHFSYGLGSIFGLFKALISNERLKFFKRCTTKISIL